MAESSIALVAQSVDMQRGMAHILCTQSSDCLIYRGRVLYQVSKLLSASSTSTGIAQSTIGAAAVLCKFDKYYRRPAECSITHVWHSR